MKRVVASRTPLRMLKLTMKDVNWFVVLFATILPCLALSSCRTVSSFPKVERCLIGDEGLLCYDPKEDENYVLSFEESKNYVAISPESYEILKEWIERRLHGKTAIECTVP